MWTVWGLWICTLGLAVITGFWCLSSARKNRFDRARRRKQLYSREAIVNFGITSDQAETIAFSRTAPKLGTYEVGIRAACMRARWAADVFNCVSEECFLDSILRAKAADKSKEDLGLIAGLPVSVCDALATTGLQAAVGVIEHVNDGVADEDCAAVAALRGAGGIVVCKSAVSTYGVNRHDTYSPLLGATLNPWDPKLTVSGPDGGGAVLCALGVAKIHVGTESVAAGADMRLPSFAFSHDRASTQGRRPVPGPAAPISLIACDVATLTKAVSVILEPMLIARNDPLAVPMPFDTAAYESREKLVVGIPTGRGWVQESLSLDHSAANALKKRGHKVIEFPAGISSKELVVLRTALYTAERLRTIPTVIDPRGSDPFVNAVKFWLTVPPFLRAPIAAALERTPWRRYLGWILHGVQLGSDDRNYQRLRKRRDEIRSTLVQRMVRNGVDALIMPCNEPQPRNRKWVSLVDAFGGIHHDFSMLNLPVGSAPVVVSSSKERSYMPSPAEEFQRVSVIVVVPPWQDELCLSLLRDLEEEFGTEAPPNISDSFRKWSTPSSEGEFDKETTPLLNKLKGSLQAQAAPTQ